ncbi:hypothetical protein BJY00DRAFT_92274 [Aspergillus carlsbadensis]|nr:hypothetical protein BJY00DRAFT_92274 [Aspergillus carlsbadensis]
MRIVFFGARIHLPIAVAGVVQGIKAGLKNSRRKVQLEDREHLLTRSCGVQRQERVRASCSEETRGDQGYKSWAASYDSLLSGSKRIKMNTRGTQEGGKRWPR